MAVLDMQNPFYIVNHQILLYQLKAIDFNRKALKWMQSYISVKMVDVGGLRSELNLWCLSNKHNCLLLFLLYINDMEAARSCPLFFYEEESALLVSAEC